MTKPKYAFEIYREHNPNPRSVAKDSPILHWYWRCRHRNGKIIADGAEGYSSKAKLIRSLENLINGIQSSEIKEIK